MSSTFLGSGALFRQQEDKDLAMRNNNVLIRGRSVSLAPQNSCGAPKLIMFWRPVDGISATVMQENSSLKQHSLDGLASIY